MRILVPLDGSELAERALGPAIQLACHAQPSATLMLFRAARLSSILAGGYLAGPMTPMEGVDISNEAECAKYLQAVAARPELTGISVEIYFLTGIPSDAICQAARDQRADFIVMASHGRTGFARTAWGSVTDEVLRRSHIPTLLVRADQPVFAQQALTHPLTLLVPLDGSPLAEGIIAPAVTLARAFDGQIRLMHVLVDHKTDDQMLWHQAQDYLAAMRRRLEDEGITTDYVIMHGHPADAIAVYAQEHTCDLIAIATHGRSGIPRMVLGSMASALVNHLNLPLLIVHPSHVEQQFVSQLSEEETFTA